MKPSLTAHRYVSQRRRFLQTLLAVGAMPASGLAFAAETPAQRARIGAAWRGPNPDDPYFAGVLIADWERKTLTIAHAVPLPTRPHGLLPEDDGSLLVVGVRPGAWLMRIDAQGKVAQQASLEGEGDSRLGGHAVLGSKGEVIYNTETDYALGRGRIGVRDRRTLKKLDQWDSHGIEPHQLLLDTDGSIVVANGGVPRTLADKKVELHRMDSSLVRLDGRNGRLLRQWKLDDPRLSLRHLAWNEGPDGHRRLGIAMQAEYDDPAMRKTVPSLAVLDGDALTLPQTGGAGYAGDITPAGNGGFVISNNQTGLAQLWQPNAPDRIAPVVDLQETYALAPWQGPQPGGGILVATALGLVRWHPTAKPLFLRWPQPMAVDNHWVLVGEV
jgi:hypothetical protein